MPIFYTDGSCRAVTRLGGWGYARVLRDGKVLKTAYQAYSNTTVNRMELMGAIEAIRSVSGSKRIEIFTDSMYVVRLGNKVAKGYRGYSLMTNGDLWSLFGEACGSHRVSIHHVKGHNGNTLNELADKLAGKAYQNALANKDTIEDSKRDAQEGRPVRSLPGLKT